MHFGFASFHSPLEIGTIRRDSSNSYYREHPGESPHILVASMTHPGVFQPVAAGLETSRTPAKVRQELFQGGEAVDILNFRDKSSQRRDIAYWKVLGFIGQLAKEVLYLFLHLFNSSIQSPNPFSQNGYLSCQGWLPLNYSHTNLSCFYEGFSHNLPYFVPAGISQGFTHLFFPSVANIVRTRIGYKESEGGRGIELVKNSNKFREKGERVS